VKLASSLRSRAGVSMRRQRVGKSGEELAVAALVGAGYAVLARRYRTRQGEIDIIAEDRGTVVFVEVKARVSGAFGGAAAAVTPLKQRRIAGMAVDYLSRRGWLDRPCRFDVVAIDEVGSSTPRLTHYRSAFDGDTHL